MHAALDLVQRIDVPTESIVLMVTHGHFIREMLNLMLDLRHIRRFPHNNCGMTMVSFDSVWTLEFCNR